MSVEVLPDVSGDPETFLDMEVLRDTLEYALGDCKPVVILKVIYESGSHTGDNYLGLIYRIKVHYRHLVASNGKVEIFNCIAKCLPNTKPNSFLHDNNIFLKEKLFYQQVLPQLRLLHHDKEKFGAKLYHTIREPMKTLIFEDLQTLQFGMASRESGLDFTHAALVLEKLGKFHAMTMLLAAKEPQITRFLHSGLVSEMMLQEDAMLLPYFRSEMAALEARIRTWNGFEKIADKVHTFHQNFRDNLLKIVAPEEDDIYVINHGDLWVNNFLFKYQDKEKQKPCDILFVDFQMSLWGSPGFDINYFLNTSVQLEVLKNERLQLLQVYYNSLSSTLATQQRLEQEQIVKIPTFNQILHEVKKREAWGFFASFTVFPMISMDKELSGDSCVENLADEEFARKKLELMFASKKVHEALSYSLRRFDEMGVLDKVLKN